MAVARRYGSAGLGQARMPLVPLRRPEKQAPYSVPMVEFVWSKQVPARVFGPMGAMVWPPLRRGRRAA